MAQQSHENRGLPKYGSIEPFPPCRTRLLSRHGASHFIAISVAICDTFCMTKLLQEAVEALRHLSENEQDQAARAIIDFTEHAGEFGLTDAQVAEVKRRTASKNRLFLSSAQVRTRLRHLGV